MEWVSTKTKLPESSVKVLIFHNKEIPQFAHDYSALVDGSDRTDKELFFRVCARKYHELNPIKTAYIYEAFGGKKWMVLSNSDSRQGFICNCDDVSHWTPLKYPEEE